MLGWDGSAWQLRISQGTSSESNFLSASHNLGTLGNGDTSLLVSGDWDGDGADDLAARSSDSDNWVLWLGGKTCLWGTRSFSQISDNSLGFGIKSTVARRVPTSAGMARATCWPCSIRSSTPVAFPRQRQEPVRRPSCQVAGPTPSQFSGSFPGNALIGDFDGDGKSDYASPDGAGSGWVFQLASLAQDLHVDDDYCASCSNDGYTWNVDAFASISSATDAACLAMRSGSTPASTGPPRRHRPGSPTVSGTDADAVFVDGSGSTGIKPNTPRTS